MSASPTDILAKLKPLGTAALASGRRKPRRTSRKVVLVLIGASLAGAAAALATDEDLRDSVFGSAKALGDELAGSDAETGEEVPEPGGLSVGHDERERT
ncbi:MAG TPA: hypothetical protein VN522_14060 [Solirubrobacterales bacterium]|nr:hypothetical protein [Solirubrobacterales bacterium]